MPEYLQSIIALALVGLAFGYLGYCGYRWWFGKSSGGGCGSGCSGCATKPTLVSLELPSKQER